MVKLIAKSPCDGLLPITIGNVTLSELRPTALTSVMPGRSADMDMFKKATGCAFPAPNRATGKLGARAVWMGPGQCMFIGASISTLPGFAVTDQSDGWAVMHLEGAEVEQVLARLTSVDIRRGLFKRGHTARTQLGHMPMSVTRTSETGFDLMVFRSMAKTAVHEITNVMRNLAKRQEQNETT